MRRDGKEGYKRLGRAAEAEDFRRGLGARKRKRLGDRRSTEARHVGLSAHLEVRQGCGQTQAWGGRRKAAKTMLPEFFLAALTKLGKTW